MKIRNYKGRSLENLYEAINNEMGPNAVVIPVNHQKGMGGILSAGRHELIAVVEDSEADSRVLERSTKPEYIRELADLQTRKWKTQETLLQELQQEIKKLAGKSAFLGMRGGEDVPEFARDWDMRFLENIRSKMPDGLCRSDADVFRREAASMLKVEEDFNVGKRNKQPRIIVLVGPTGSGKTTTLAKLAARWCLEKGLNAGLITTDTYRIAAVDQLKEYATLLGLDLRVAFSAGEAANAARAFADKDVILVDTPGRSHYDRIGMASLRGTLSTLGATTVMLVVPAVLDRAAARGVLRSFGVLKPSCIVLTKTDESPAPALLTTLASETDWPVVFVTDGQRVPQDIRAACRAELAEMLVPRSLEQAEPVECAEAVCV